MGRRYLIVVDMQQDFTYGALRNEEAIKVIPDVIRKVKEFDGNVIFTKDTHRGNYLETQEGQILPVEHCIAYTHGWELLDELEDIVDSARWPVYQKGTFGCVNLAIDLRAEHVKQPIESIEFIGVCTDICVISNAMLVKAYLPEVPIIIDSNCCAGVTNESHVHALEAMKSCQMQIV